jgi:uncharacterized membrane protein
MLSKFKSPIVAFLVIFSAVFFAMNSGLAYAAIGEDATFTTDSDIYYPLYSESDIKATNWVAENLDEGGIYTGRLGGVLLLRQLGETALDERIVTPTNADVSIDHKYSFYWSWNVENRKIGLSGDSSPKISLNRTPWCSPKKGYHNRIYNSGSNIVCTQ